MKISRKPIGTIKNNTIEAIVKKYNTPMYLYDEQAMIDNINDYYSSFDWVDNFKNFFAVKACPNPTIMSILHDHNCGMDCSSMGELLLAEKCGIIGEDIIFTSNDTPVEEFKKAKEMGAIINFDDISHISFFQEHVGELPELVCLRYNPGKLKEGNAIIGEPEEAKYGITRKQLFKAYADLKAAGVKRFGLHTMVASNELDPDYFIETAEMLFELIIELEDLLDITFDFVNLGGGIGIPYQPEEQKVDILYISEHIQKVYDRVFYNRKKPLNIVTEMGRMVTGPYGYLITTVRHIKNTYKYFIGTDASMADLMRPGLYGAYHHITNISSNHDKFDIFDVTGSLCENNDKFAINRKLPHDTKIGDILVIHDTGAHGHAMGFNYNAKLRPKEVLLECNNDTKIIRREETLDDYFATLTF
jgi:diaminopimelate decarboxylase